MRDWKEINSKVQWIKNFPNMGYGIKSGYVTLPTGVRGNVVAGDNEKGWEHVSLMLYAKRLPTWQEMQFVKEIFWEDEEEVVQIHPKKSHYVNLAEALHLWRPKEGDWSLMNKEDF